MRIENSITIGSAPEAVWGYLSDLEHLPEWNWAIDSTRKVTPGPVGVGTVFEQERSVPERATERLEIIHFEPIHQLVVRGTLGLFHADVRYTLEDVGSSTLVTNVADLEATGAARLVAPLAGRRIQRAVEANLRQLKARVEALDQPG